MKLTAEQEAKLEKMRQTNEHKTLYVCEKCNKKLIGMKEVREHHTNKHHYCYGIPGSKLKLAIV